MPLKRAETTVAAAPKKSKSEHPILTIASQEVFTYNVAVAEKKAAEGQVKLLNPTITGKATAFLAQVNCANQGNQVSTIKIEDETGSIVRVSSQDKYSDTDADAVSALFEGEFNKDVNDYFTETVKASFDNSFFLDKDGNFDSALFDKVSTALATIAKEAGKTSPVTSKTVVQPKPGFHVKRYIDFNAEQNARISEVVKNTVTTMPLETVEPKA